MMFQRQILHLDMDTFFVSVERLIDPSLCDLPVVVGSDNPLGRGVVAAASYEARKFGVHSAMPLRQAYRLCPQARFVNGTPGAYGEASRRIRTICEEAAPLVEMGSLEEAYLDMTGTERLYASAGEAADQIERRIRREIGLPCSFGWAENKLLAKVASGRAKPHGLLRVFSGQGRSFLSRLPLRRLPGIGPKSADLLERYGLRYLEDLERLGEQSLAQALGEPGRSLFHRARGEDDSPVIPYVPPQSIGREHTFETDTGDRPTLYAMLSLLSERVGGALRHEGKWGRRVTLKLRYSDFKTVSRATMLFEPTQDDRAIYRAGATALDQIYTRRVRTRLVGVSVSDLSTEPWALDLFGGNKSQKIDGLARAMDELRGRYGFGAVLRGSSWEARRAG